MKSLLLFVTKMKFCQYYELVVYAALKQIKRFNKNPRINTELWPLNSLRPSNKKILSCFFYHLNGHCLRCLLEVYSSNPRLNKGTVRQTTNYRFKIY